ncbi:MAG: hypothetical protein Roseis2KO_29910 [Roseivirga sp.]
MENLISRKYNFKKLKGDGKLPEVDFFIYGSIREERTKFIPENICVDKIPNVLNIEYDIENERYRFVKTSNRLAQPDAVLNEVFKDLISAFGQESFVEEFSDSNVFIDTTSLKHPFIFYLLKILKEDHTPKCLFLGYTEPYKYNYEKNSFQFNLTEKFCSNQSIPGFLRRQDPLKKRVLVSLMGFEGNRFNKVYEELKPDLGFTYAFVGFPTFQPGWQYYVYGMNIDALNSSRSFSNIIRAAADDPFDVYKELQSIYNVHKQKDITVAAIGTKPHSIGAAMFALEREEVRLYYDFPSITKKYRTTGVGKCHFYNLSLFIRNKC